MKSSQGFDWNQGTSYHYYITQNLSKRQPLTYLSPTELFLPSYAERDAHDLEHKPDPVEEIILTDEEAAAMLPQ